MPLIIEPDNWHLQQGPVSFLDGPRTGPATEEILKESESLASNVAPRQSDTFLHPLGDHPHPILTTEASSEIVTESTHINLLAPVENKGDSEARPVSLPGVDIRAEQSVDFDTCFGIVCSVSTQQGSSFRMMP